MRTTFLLFLCLAGLFLAPLPVHSQSNNRTVTVSGDVMSAVGNHRIEGALVSVTDSAGNQIEQEYTNGAGIFRFVGLRRAQYILKVSAEGYQSTELHVDLSFSSDRGITLYLKSLQNGFGCPAGTANPPTGVRNASVVFDGCITGAKCGAPDYVNSIERKTSWTNDDGIPSLPQLT